MRTSIFTLVVSMALGGCASSGLTSPSPVVSAANAPLSFTLSGTATLAADRTVVFPPWFGCYPGSNCGSTPVAQLASASIALTSATPVTLVRTAACVDVVQTGATVFALTQGNNGSCVLIAQNAAGDVVPIRIASGTPPRFFLSLNGPAVTASPMTLSPGATTTVVAAVSTIGPGPGSNAIAARVYGPPCATVTPPSGVGTATFAIAAVAPGKCIVVFDDTGTQSQAISLTVSSSTAV